ncbi:MAG: hypothetical protein AAFZ05_13620, partial [Pseudomonadota bacterium]
DSLSELSAAVAPSDDVELDELIDHLQDTTTAAGTTTQEELISNYVSLLTRAGTDSAKFSAIYARLEADKSVKSAALTDIGKRYTEFSGFGSLYKTRASKLKQIKASFRERQNFETEAKVIDELVPWQ